jgi:hypothetical protein
MNSYERVWKILKTTLKNWYEQTLPDKKVNEQELYRAILEYMEIISKWYVEGEE